MNGTDDMNKDRLPFFDNLRSLMVLMVLVFHAGASYSSAVSFWPFHDQNPSRFVDILMLLADTFMMSILFFVAGYFALQSARKTSGWGFIKGKFKRIGLPWLLATLLVLPVLDYIHYSLQTSGDAARSYAAHWLSSMQKILEFHVGWIDMNSYLDMSQQFYQRYLWFLSLLLLFFVVFIGLYSLWTRGTENKPPSLNSKTVSKASIYIALVVMGSVLILLFALARFTLYPEFMGKGWFSLGNIIQFQIGKFIFYACFFGLGCYACFRNWFYDGLDFGRPWIWGAGCFLLFGGNIYVMMNLSRAVSPSLGFKLAFVIIYPLWTLSFLGFFTMLTLKRWNRTTPLNRSLAGHSYNMYLIHYAIPMTLPVLLSFWMGGPTVLKFLMVALVTVILSYGISRFVLKPHPKLVVIGLIGLSIILVMLTH